MSEAEGARFSLLFRALPAAEGTSALEALRLAGVDGAKYSRRGVLVVPVVAEVAGPVEAALAGRLCGGELRVSTVQTAAPVRFELPPEVLALARALELGLGFSGVIYEEDS